MFRSIALVTAPARRGVHFRWRTWSGNINRTRVVMAQGERASTSMGDLHKNMYPDAPSLGGDIGWLAQSLPISRCREALMLAELTYEQKALLDKEDDAADTWGDVIAKTLKAMGGTNVVPILDPEQTREEALVATFYVDSDTHAIRRDGKALTPDDKKALFVSFRGTEKSFMEWIGNFQASQKEYVPYNGEPRGFVMGWLTMLPFVGNVKLHRGIYNGYLKLRDLQVEKNGEKIGIGIIETVKPLVKDVDLVVLTGHSKGAALASHSSLDIHRLLVEQGVRDKTKVVLCTFASPRAGNSAFAEEVDNCVDRSWRIQVEDDLVPRIPTGGLIYKHVANHVMLPRNKEDEVIVQKENDLYLMGGVASLKLNGDAHSCINHRQKLIEAHMKKFPENAKIGNQFFVDVYQAMIEIFEAKPGDPRYEVLDKKRHEVRAFL